MVAMCPVTGVLPVQHPTTCISVVGQDTLPILPAGGKIGQWCMAASPLSDCSRAAVGTSS